MSVQCVAGADEAAGRITDAECREALLSLLRRQRQLVRIASLKARVAAAAIDAAGLDLASGRDRPADFLARMGPDPDFWFPDLPIAMTRREMIALLTENLPFPWMGMSWETHELPEWAARHLYDQGPDADEAMAIFALICGRENVEGAPRFEEAA